MSLVPGVQASSTASSTQVRASHSSDPGPEPGPSAEWWLAVSASSVRLRGQWQFGSQVYKKCPDGSGHSHLGRYSLTVRQCSCLGLGQGVAGGGAGPHSELVSVVH